MAKYVYHFRVYLWGIMHIECNLDIIAQFAAVRDNENDDFRQRLAALDNAAIDALAHNANDRVSQLVDCTACGNCCRKLVINVEPEDMQRAADGQGMTTAQFKEQYIEESAAGRLFVSAMPCHFLADNKCTAYEHRFTDCREFPHLHKPGFKERLPHTLMYYGMCPIIFNVVEEMKLSISQ